MVLKILKLPKKYGEKYGTKADRAVYNGPFKVINWQVEDKIQLVKNDKYWDKKNVKLDKVNYKVLKDPAKLVHHYMIQIRLMIQS